MKREAKTHRMSARAGFVALLLVAAVGGAPAYADDFVRNITKAPIVADGNVSGARPRLSDIPTLPNGGEVFAPELPSLVEPMPGGVTGGRSYDLRFADVLPDLIGCGLEHHLAVAYGEHRPILRDVAAAMGVPVLEL